MKNVWRIIIVTCFFSLSVSAQALAETIKLWLREDLTECTGVGKQQCFWVKYRAEGSWELLYSQIEGFSYKPGYRYILLVDRIKREQVPADASVYRYKLKKVVQRKKMPVKAVKSTLPEQGNAGQIYGTKWKLLRINGADAGPTKAFIRFEEKEKGVHGNGGCNGFFGAATVSGDSIGFSEIASTLMACIDGKISQLESDLFTLLRNQVFTYDIRAGKLNMYHKGALVLVFAEDEQAMQKAGIQGRVIWKEGNQMPGPGQRNGGSRPVEREILIYGLAGSKDVVAAGEGGFYKEVHTHLIGSLRSDREGNYHYALPAGTYSVFVKEKGLLYANRSDGEGNINPVIVSAEGIAKLDIVIDYAAAY